MYDYFYVIYSDPAVLDINKMGKFPEKLYFNKHAISYIHVTNKCPHEKDIINLLHVHLVYFKTGSSIHVVPGKQYYICRNVDLPC